MQRLNIGVHLQQREQARQDAVPVPMPVDYEQPPARRDSYGYRVVDGVASLELVGVLMKHEASAVESTSTVMMRRTVRRLRTDTTVKAVIFQIDSPGGNVSGLYELADDIAALAAAKPVYAHAANICASAAYALAAQCKSISATRTALVGSLGTFCVAYDASQAAAMTGVKVILIKGRINGRESQNKGAGVPGTELTPAQIERMQEGIDDLNAQFYDAVTRGPRKPDATKVEGWFVDGGVWIAQKALASGLVDAVESYDDLFARVSSTVNNSDPASVPDGRDVPGEEEADEDDDDGDEDLAKDNRGGPKAAAQPPATAGATKEVRVSEPTNGTAPAQADRILEPNKTPATAFAIDQACPGASSDFKLDCLVKNMTLADTQQAFIGYQATQIRSRDEDIVKLKETHAGDLQAKDATITEMQQKMDAMPRGNPAAAASVDTAKPGQVGKPTKDANGVLRYGDGTPVGQGDGIAKGAAAIKVPGQSTAS
jgi:signal peptide peptidase SppA